MLTGAGEPRLTTPPGACGAARRARSRRRRVRRSYARVAAAGPQAGRREGGDEGATCLTTALGSRSRAARAQVRSYLGWRAGGFANLAAADVATEAATGKARLLAERDLVRLC